MPRAHDEINTEAEKRITTERIIALMVTGLD